MLAHYEDKETGHLEAVKGLHKAVSVSITEHLTTLSEEYTATAGGDIAAVAIITPTTGCHVAIQSLSLSSNSGTGVVNLDFVTSGIKVYRYYAAKSFQAPAIWQHHDGALNEALTLSASGLGNGDKVFLIVNYVLHNGG